MVVVALAVRNPEELAALSGRQPDRVLLELEVARRRVEAAIAGVVDHCDPAHG